MNTDEEESKRRAERHPWQSAPDIRTDASVARRLVKAEWDEAEAWLKDHPDRREQSEQSQGGGSPGGVGQLWPTLCASPSSLTARSMMAGKSRSLVLRQRTPLLLGRRQLEKCA